MSGTVHLGEREVVLRTEADDACEPVGAPVLKERMRWIGRAPRLRPDARMIVVEDERPRVRLVARAADAHVAGAQITVGNVFGDGAVALTCTCSPIQGRPLPVRGDDDPLFTQRMPALFPDAASGRVFRHLADRFWHALRYACSRGGPFRRHNSSRAGFARARCARPADVCEAIRGRRAYSVEIPSCEGPQAMRAVIDEAAARHVRVHRVSQGSGVMLQTDDEIREMLALGARTRHRGVPVRRAPRQLGRRRAGGVGVGPGDWVALSGARISSATPSKTCCTARRSGCGRCWSRISVS